MGVEQGVGDFRALLQPRRMAAGIAWRVLRQSPGCSKRMRMLRMLRTSPKAGAIRRRMPSCSSMRRSRCSSLPVAQGFQRAARRCSSWRVRGGACVRAGASGARVRRRRRRAGRAGGGAGSAHGTIIARPASRAATLRRPRERASALQRHLALLLQAAEDGVGDLHPLGIGIVAVGQITCPGRGPGRTPRRRRSRWWNRSCSAGAGPPAPVARQPGDPVRLQRHRRRAAACRRFREIGQS